MHRFFIAVVLLTPFCLLAFNDIEQDSANPLEVSYSESGIQWSVFVPSTGLVLTVSGPNGLYWRREYDANSRPNFGLVDEQGVARPEGLYRWELLAQLPPGPGGEVPDEPNPVESGSFVISGGTIVPKPDDVQPAMVEEGAPLRSLFLDREGRLGVGTTVPRSQLHLKGSSPAFTLEDTSTGGGLFTLRAVKKGDGSLGLFDEAGQARWLIDNEGRIGINTINPTSTLTVDGYIEATKGFLVNGRPLRSFGLGAGSQPLYTETAFQAIFGGGAGAVNTAGDIAFFGANSGHSNTTGNYNSFFGQGSGYANTVGVSNSFFGCGAGNQNTTASHNSAFGYQAGLWNVTGTQNAFFGSEAGLRTTASYNSFFGRRAGYSNASGEGNAFFGTAAGDANTTGFYNNFFGWDAGGATTTGHENSFFGDSAGLNNTTGSFNAFFGRVAGLSNTIENNNTSIGAFSDVAAGITNATAVGYKAKVSASNSLVLGSINAVNEGTSYVNVGIGTTTPARQLHLAGPNAVFRMDRPSDTAAFLLVRTDAAGNPLKTFVVGTNATESNQGEFIINDIGNAVGGMGQRRMTIRNDGTVEFTGNVFAPNLSFPSSRALKSNIKTFENAVETVNRLRGVRFDWKDSGEPAVGLIAEEVDDVIPELVAHEDGQARGVNYANLVAVLVEAVKEQQKTIQEQKKKIEDQSSRLERLERLLEQK